MQMHVYQAVMSDGNWAQLAWHNVQVATTKHDFESGMGGGGGGGKG